MTDLERVLGEIDRMIVALALELPSAVYDQVAPKLHGAVAVARAADLLRTMGGRSTSYVDMCAALDALTGGGEEKP